jgi:hypothetical protein
MTSEHEKSQVSQKSVLILNIGGMIIVLVAATSVWLITTHFGIISNVSLFSSVRTLLLTSSLIVALPIATLGEYWLSQTNKRKFLWKSVILTMSILCLFILVTTFLLTLFDLLLSGLFWMWQMPLVAASALIGLSIMSITMRHKRFKKWQNDFGWWAKESSSYENAN